VRSPHDIRVHHIAQNVRVAPLTSSRHRLTDERKCLMAIQTTQLNHFAVEFEPLIGELCMTKTDSPLVAVEKLRAFQKPHMNRIQIVILKIPQLDRAEVVEVHCVNHRLGRGLRRRQLL